MEKKSYIVGVEYKGLKNFQVEASSEEEAMTLGEAAYRAGRTPVLYGNEYERVAAHRVDLITEPQVSRLLLEEARAWVEERKLAGWTRKDFAEALKEYFDQINSEKNQNAEA